RDFLGLDLADDFGDVAGACLRLRRNAFWRDKAEAIGRAEIAESVMGRDDLPAPRRNFRDFRRDVFLKYVELAEIIIRIGTIDRSATGIDSDQGIADIGNIDLGIGDRLPGMRVWPDTPFLAHLLRAYTLCRDNDRGLCAGRLDQTIDPTLQTEAVHQNEPCGAELFRVGRLWLIDMGVAIRADECRDLDPLAADIAGEIGEN